METTKKKISFQDNSEVEVSIRVIRDGELASSARDQLVDFIEDEIINDDNMIETEEDDLEEGDLEVDAFQGDILDDDDDDDDDGLALDDDWLQLS